MKRFLLFKGSDYYPSGGWYDFAGAYDTLEEAKAAAEKPDYPDAESVKDWLYHWAHIIDIETMQVVLRHVDDDERTIRGFSTWEAVLRG